MLTERQVDTKSSDIGKKTMK